MVTVVHENLENVDAKMSARDVSVFYGQKKAIDDVSIDIPTEYVTAFIGPSGCGKSTFLRSLNRMNDTIPSARVEGEITLDGENIYQWGTFDDQGRAHLIYLDSTRPALKHAVVAGSSTTEVSRLSAIPAGIGIQIAWKESQGIQGFYGAYSDLNSLELTLEPLWLTPDGGGSK